MQKDTPKNLVNIRFQWIDAMRGIAAVSVMILHFHEYAITSVMSPSALYMSMYRFLDLGRYGIMLFFIISGFVVPFSLHATHRRTRKEILRHFVVARIFRLYPAYWLALLLAVMLGMSAVSNVAALINITMIQRLFGVNDALGVFWTLPIELTFYALCILLFIGNIIWQPEKVYLLGLAMLVLTSLAAIVQYNISTKIPVTLFGALYAMIFGMQLRYWHDGNLLAKRYVQLLISWYFLLLPVICILAYSSQPREIWYRYAISDVIAYSTFMIFWHAKRHNYWLIAQLGKISYSVYLFHPVVGFYFIKHVLPSTGIHDIHVALFFSCMVVIGFSALTYRLIELPMIRFGHSLTK